MKKYLIIPPCSDFNRGDQALVWETARFAEEAGFKGEFYFMAEAKEPVEQSERHGLKAIRPLLEHPSRKFKSKENIKIDFKLLLKWGGISLIDFMWSIILLSPLKKFISFFFSGDKKYTYNLFKEVDAVFVKGGGFIHSYGGISAPYYIYFQLYHIFLAQSLGKKVYILPNSFGPFKGFCVKWLVKKAFKGSQLVVSRENRSASMCKKSLNINISSYPDFGFFLPNGNFIDKKRFLEQQKIPTGKKLVAITARPHRFLEAADPTASYQNFINTMRNFAKWLYKNNYFPVFIEHVYAINNHENDGFCIEEIIKELEPTEYSYYKNRSLNCMDLKLIYSFFDYIVGTRFHSMIFSMANKVPGIAITYVGNKGEGIMEDMNLSNFFIKISMINTELLIDKFKELTQEENVVLEHISTYLNEANVKRNELIDKIKEK